MRTRERFWNWVIRVGDRLIIRFWDLREKIKWMWFKAYVKIKGIKLNMKGECIYEYYKKIVDGTWEEKDWIEDYEEGLKKGIEEMKEKGYEVGREDMAKEMCRVMEMVG